MSASNFHCFDYTVATDYGIDFHYASQAHTASHVRVVRKNSIGDLTLALGIVLRERFLRANNGHCREQQRKDCSPTFHWVISLLEEEYFRLAGSKSKL